MMQTGSSSLTDRLMGVATFKAPIYKDIAHDPGAMQPAAIIVAITAVISGVVGGLIGGRGLVGSVILAILSALVGWVIGSWLTAFVAKTFFKGETNASEMMRVLGHTYIFNILGIIPVIGSLIGAILTVIANVLAIREASGLDTTKSILTAIIVGVIVFLVIAVLAGIFAAGTMMTGAVTQ